LLIQQLLSNLDLLHFQLGPVLVRNLQLAQLLQLLLLNRLDVPHLLLDLVADLLPFFELVPLTLLLLFFIQSDLLAQLIGVLLDEGLPFSLEFYFNVPFLLLNLYDALELASVLLGLFLLPNLLLVLLLLAGVHQFLVNFAI